MATSDEVPRYGSAFTRRTLLTAAGGLGLAVAPFSLTELPARADTGAASSAGRFAVITDTHTNRSTTERTADLARVMNHIASRSPDFVLNCGDVTDYGVEDEFALYRSTIPDALAPRIHHVPGNHECQWNADAWEAYHKHFGPTRYSFDAAGLHLIAMDPMVSQQWPPWNFGDPLLSFLRKDLEQVPADTPIVLFDHYPLDDTRFYVCNEDALHALIEPYRVRMIFAGHIHYRQVYQYNGLTQIVGNAIIKGPVYYWAERITDADGDRVVISEVMVPADSAVTETVIATARLDGAGPGGALGPLHTTVATGDSAAKITVRAPRNTGVSQVSARVYPLGVPEVDWIPLTDDGTDWSGQLDVSELAPGAHRLQVQSTDADGIRWSTTHPLSVPSSGPARVAWNHRLGRTVFADLALHDDMVVASTTDGLVEAFVPSKKGIGRRWRRELAGVFGGPAFTPAGSRLIVGSTDHRLYALRGSNGKTGWRRDLGAPVTGQIAVLRFGGRDRIVTAAGNQLYCLELNGDTVWRASLNGAFTGLAATDGDRVYAGSGDGNAYAFEAAGGEPAWAANCALGGDDYHLMLESPWTARIRILPNGDVLATTASAAVALDPATGQQRWRTDGIVRGGFTPPTVDDEGVLVFDGKVGTAYLLDPLTGKEIWTDGTLPGAPGAGANFGSAPLPTGTKSCYWMPSGTGLLTRMDLSNRTVTPVLQTSIAFGTSMAAHVRPGTAGDVLVTVDNNGTLHGITGLASLDHSGS